MFSQCGLDSPVLHFCDTGLSNHHYVEPCLTGRDSSHRALQSVPRIKFCQHPRYSKYKRIIRKLGPNGHVYYEYLHFDSDGEENGTFYGSYNSPSDRRRLAAAHGSNSGPTSAADNDVVSLPILFKDDEITLSISAPPLPAETDGDDDLPLQQMPIPPLLSPISESQVSSRSSERIRSLQASLGGDAFAHRHGRAPPAMAPFYQSGAVSNSSMSPEASPIAIPTFIHAQ